MASRRSAMALEQHGVADALGEISSHHMLKDGVPATGSEVSGQLSSRVLCNCSINPTFKSFS